MTGNGLNAIQAFEQDLACINILDFDLVPRADGSVGTEIARAMIKAVNLTPYNYTKHGMNLTSLEAIFARA
jgi:probable phosphoglycerate mutase